MVWIRMPRLQRTQAFSKMLRFAQPLLWALRITHNSNAGESGAEVILRLEEVSEVALDITIVLANNNVESIFYQSGA
jgi:hypothetical protein